MASTDARPVPIKNTAYRAVFPILDADGDLVTGATGLDSEVSKDQGTFADCTNEATEIATASGMYYLDLTSTEMNADCVAVIVKTSTSGAKTTVLVFYPQENGDIKTDVQSYGGTAGTFSGGRPGVNTTHAAGTAWGSGAITSGAIASGALTAIAAAVWDRLTSALSTASSIGKLLVDNVNATISSRASQTSVDTVAGYVDTEVAAILAAVDTEVAAIKAKTDNLPAAPAAVSDIPTATAVADQVWDEVLSGHLTSSTTGAALNAAGAAGDPWSTSLPGAYGSGTAGKIVGDNLNATVSSRLASASYTAPPSAATIAAAVWDYLTSAATTVGSLGKLLVDNVNATIGSRLASASYTAPLDANATRTALGLATNNLDTQLSTIAGYLDTEIAAILAAVDTEVAAIKAKTDNLPEGIQKNTQLAAFPFFMVDSADHVTGKTGLSVTAQRSIDGAAFGACANAVAEVGNGVYKITLAASDLNGDTITLKFTATGADACVIVIKTEA